MSKRYVYKYGTGQEIPPGAKYLCTQVEWVQTSEDKRDLTASLDSRPQSTDLVYRKRNEFVWHYYEVEIG